MRWVYILKCEDDYYYVGETTRLYRRFWEHFQGRGGFNTYNYTPDGVVAIYKVDTLGKYFEYNRNVISAIENKERYNKWLLQNFNEDRDEYDNLYTENNIAECMMLHNKESWEKIRGGKYTKDVRYMFPINNDVKDFPLCHCRLPCDIHKKDGTNYLYFRCAKKNMWEGFKDHFDVEEPCKFYSEYLKDKEFRMEEQILFEDRRHRLKECYKKSSWLKNIPEYDETAPLDCVGGCNRSDYTKMSYDYQEISICFDCFIDKNDELRTKYTSRAKCYIKL